MSQESVEANSAMVKDPSKECRVLLHDLFKTDDEGKSRLSCLSNIDLSLACLDTDKLSLDTI